MDFCGILVLVAGLREVGLDPDSINYEYAFIHYDDEELSTAIEYSYFMISQILSSIVNDVHILFLFYAFWGVLLKFKAFRILSPDMWFVPVIVYLSFIFQLHEMTQIRTGVMSGLFLLAIQPIAERKWVKSLLLIGIGAFLSYICPCAYTFGVFEQQGYVFKVTNDVDGYSAHFIYRVFCWQQFACQYTDTLY